MKRRLFSQMIAFVLVISFLIPGITLPVTAVTTANDERTGNIALDDNLTKKENPTIYENTVLRADDPSIAKDSKILNYIDSTQFNAAKHTQRLTHLEDLNTYVFANADGTRSVYMMDENVKYIDKSGIVKEKDLTLTSKSGGFGIVQSDMDLLIPNDPVKGIDLAYSGFAVKLTPQGLENTTTAIQSGNSIVYEKAYGENTKLKYTPLLSGVKEDIILTEYTDDVTYTFVLETDGLSLYHNGSKYYLAENEKADPVFYLGEIIIYDAIGKPDIGTMTVETVTEGQEYLLTVSANEEFLSDPTTLYPVTIDPSLTVSDTANGINSIEDAPVYAGYPNTKFGAYLFNPIGTPDSTFGIGRTVVRLNGLINSEEYIGITDTQIQNVTFHILDVSGTASQNVKLHPLTGNTTWTENTVTWNNIGDYNTSANYGTSMGAGTWAVFNITGLVKAWKNNTYSQNAGFILVNENEANLKTFASSEYSTASYRPYVVMTYKGTVDISASPTYMLVGQKKQVSCSTNPSGLSVSWASNNTAIATVNSTGLVTGISEGTVKITATYTDSTTGTTSSDYVNLCVYDSLGIRDNTNYYVMNYSSKRFLSLESASDTILTNVYTRERSTSTLSQWKVEKQTDGTFQFISVYSSTGKVLDKKGTNIDIYPDYDVSDQKFSVYRIDSDTYAGLYYIRHGNYYVAQDSDYNVYLTTTASDSAVWSFMAVDQGHAELVCHDYTYIENGENRHFDTSVNKFHFETVLYGLGYSSHSYVNSSSETAYTYLKRDDVFVFMGHGASGRILFCTEGDVVTGGILAHSNMVVYHPDLYHISDLNKNELCLNRCVIYLGCRTGTDYVIGPYTYNLVDATFDKGAHFVLGTTETLYTNQVNDWIEYFLDAIWEGVSILQAMDYADRTLGPIMVPYDKDNGMEGTKEVYGLPSYCRGDTIQYLDI